jgi:hypothetical protein
MWAILIIVAGYGDDTADTTLPKRTKQVEISQPDDNSAKSARKKSKKSKKLPISG